MSENSFFRVAMSDDSTARNHKNYFGRTPKTEWSLRKAYESYQDHGFDSAIDAYRAIKNDLITLKKKRKAYAKAVDELLADIKVNTKKK